MIPQTIELIPWDGGECPLVEHQTVIFIYRNGWVGIEEEPLDLKWTHGGLGYDVVEYFPITLVSQREPISDLRGWVIIVDEDGTDEVYWAGPEGLSKTRGSRIEYHWKHLERWKTVVRPMTPVDLNELG